MTVLTFPRIDNSNTVRILITGCSGYVGTRLSCLIKDVYKDVHLVGLSRARPLDPSPFDELITADLRDAQALTAHITKAHPYNYVFHLASQSYVQNSWEFPDITYQTNLGGTENLINALKLQTSNSPYNIKTKVILASSSEVYQYSLNQQLIDETCPIGPRSPYGLSKYGQELILKRESNASNLDYTILRLFNHSGPGRPPIFIDTKTAQQISEIEAGQRPPLLSYRTLDATRDFLDYRDALTAYLWCLDSATDNKTLNVCSSIQLKLGDLVNQFTSLSTNRHIKVLIDAPASALPSDGGFLVGSNSLISRITGWSPQYNYLHNTVPSILQYSRGLPIP